MLKIKFMKKIDKLDFIKIKNSTLQKTVSREWKENTSHRLRENIYKNTCSNGLLSKIYKELLKLDSLEKANSSSRNNAAMESLPCASNLPDRSPIETREVISAGSVPCLNNSKVSKKRCDLIWQKDGTICKDFEMIHYAGWYTALNAVTCVLIRKK